MRKWVAASLAPLSAMKGHTMKKYMIVCVIVMALLAPLNARAQNVNADWDHSVHNFSSFKTYQWLKPVRTTGNPLMDQRIVTAIDAQMAQKGFQHVENTPDVLVTYGTGLQRQKSATVTGMGRLRMGGGMGNINQNISNGGLSWWISAMPRRSSFYGAEPPPIRSLTSRTRIVRKSRRQLQRCLRNTRQRQNK
jgi:Domain of unknown function (DUF4136)